MKQYVPESIMLLKPIKVGYDMVQKIRINYYYHEIPHILKQKENILISSSYTQRYNTNSIQFNSRLICCSVENFI